MLPVTAENNLILAIIRINNYFLFNFNYLTIHNAN